MFITQILLPKCDNFGQPFERERYRPFHRRLTRRYGGWTRKGQAEGTWLSPSGESYTEEHWVYEVGHEVPDLRFWRREKQRLMVELEQQEIWMIQYLGRRI
jgi:hypothetical protein